MKKADTFAPQESYVVDFNHATTTGYYNIDINEGDEIANAPIAGELKGILKVVNAGDYIEQIVETTAGETYKRMIGSEWTTAGGTGNLDDFYTKEETDEALDDIRGQLGIFGDSFTNQIKTYTKVNDVNMTETYRVLDMNGLKFMFIEYDFSDSEYNGATSGMFYRTFDIPAEAQVFNAIFMATQVSNARTSGENHLSRIMQNTEIVSNTSLRVRYRHDELTKPFIGKVRVMAIGI